MATDGVKIIDGDTAFDVYTIFMDSYDQGADGAELRKIYEQEKKQYSFSDFEYEIFVTVYALALWEIGELTPEILQEVERVIAKGAGVSDWTEQVDEKAGKARQKELSKLWSKINAPNPKPRKRKKYAKVKKLIFNPGDIVVFQFPDSTYGLTVVADVMQYRGECDYMLCRTTFNSAKKPTMENIAELHICGSLVPSGHNGISPELIEKMQNLTDKEMKAGILDSLMEELTASMPKLKMPWVMIIQHKTLMKEDYISNFEIIGNIQLRSNSGSSRFAPSYQSFCEEFYTKDYEFNNQMPGMPQSAEFTVDELCEQPYMD
jgi:hypothetical protein